MKVRWLGHAAFLLTSSDNTRIITDPYACGSFDGAIGYGPITGPAAGVSISHDHADHNCTDGIAGDPKVIRGAGEHEVGPFRVTGIPTFHDDDRGSRRGGNTVFVFEADGLRVCHLGDLGHVLADADVAAIGRVDVLLVPVGGTFTLDAEGAHRVAKQLKARVIIPMHFKTPKLGFDIAPVEDFLTGRANVTRAGSPEVELSPGTLPAEPGILVLEHAL